MGLELNSANRFHGFLNSTAIWKFEPILAVVFKRLQFAFVRSKGFPGPLWL